jgi:hypothetical protein
MKYTKSFSVFGFTVIVLYERQPRFTVEITHKKTHQVHLSHYYTLLGAVAFAKKAARMASWEWQEDVTVKVVNRAGELCYSASAYHEPRVRLVSNFGHRA